MALQSLIKKEYMYGTDPVSSKNLNEIQDAILDIQQQAALITEQTLTSSQQEQVRNNIGAADAASTTESIMKTFQEGIEVTTPPFSSLPVTFNVEGMTANHDLVQDGFAYVCDVNGMPLQSAMGSSWEITSGNGTITISGTFSGSVAAVVKASFCIKRKVTATS